MERLGEFEIFSIFERISKNEDKNSFAVVCKFFLKVACSHLRSLDNQLPDFLHDMLIRSPKMVSFECPKPFSNNHMKLIAQSCPNIERLNLSKLHCPDLEMDKEFDDVGLCALVKACIHLDHVDLSGRLRFKEIGIGFLVRSSKNLRILRLNYCVNVTDTSLKIIGKATCIKELHLRGCYMIRDLGLEYLANGKLKHCLERLYLDKCDRITDNGMIHLKKFASLRTLSLSRCGAYITDYGVISLCELTNLRELDLDFLTNITDISLREIGSKCLKMLLLSLTGCNKITSVGLRAFSRHLHLSQLMMFSCDKFSWEDIKSIALTCPNLRYLGLSRQIKKATPKEAYQHISINNHHFQIKWE